jgi:tRNA1(Val) A37 N6-methylase TrmN6
MIGINNLLNKSGKFLLIYPTWETKKVLKNVEAFDLYVSAQTIIYSRLDKPSKRTIFEIQREPCKTNCSKFISGNQDVGYSNEYKKLMKEFYTIF